MPVIVDTYNVLHVTGILPPELAGIDVAELAELIAASRYGTETVWLVCDGRPASGRSQRHGRIITHYAGKGSDADAHIGRMIDASTTPRRLTVVSSDHRVRRMALRRRCVALASESFLGHLAVDAVQVVRPRIPRPSVPLDERQIDRWVREFGLDPDVLELRRSTASPAPGSAAGSDVRQSPSRGNVNVPPPNPARRRALEGVERLDQVDPTELDRFDMNEWLDWLPAEERTNRASRRKRRT